MDIVQTIAAGVRQRAAEIENGRPPATGMVNDVLKITTPDHHFAHAVFRGQWICAVWVEGQGDGPKVQRSWFTLLPTSVS